MDSSDTTPIFTTPMKISKETGLPYKQILSDIHSNVLPAFRKGNSYYIYSTDASKYIFNLVCTARGIEVAQILDRIEKGLGINDKSKD